MSTRFWVQIGVGLLCLLCFQAVLAQRAGQSVSIDYGVVTGVRSVNLHSDAVPAGAVVGGTLGVVAGSGKSSNKKARNAIIGGTAGAMLASSGQRSRNGMMYTVGLTGGGEVQVVSDQREIRTGDCVAVERAGQTANIRRMSMGYCERQNRAAIEAVENAAKAEAVECQAAKQQLVDAETDEAADLAARKVMLLCND